MKKVLGIIVEFNPFHNGHLYFINEAKEKIKPDVVIAVMSSSFTMRGDIMVMNKFDRTSLMLDYGIDLVLELSFISCVQSADYFCYNAVNILNSFKITHLAFGSELGSITKLNALMNLISNPLYEQYLKDSINKGHSYPSSALSAIRKLTNDEELINNFNLPNNTLGLGYLKAIDEINPKINVEVIPRILANFYDTTVNDSNIASANSIRLLMKKNEEYSSFIPSNIHNYKFIDQTKAEEHLLFILKYIFNNHSLETIANVLGVNEGIQNRINNFLAEAKSYDHLISLIETKRYPKNRIKRTLLHIILNTPKEFENGYHSYLRVLGMNEIGKKHLSTLSAKTKSKIITTYKNHKKNDIIDIELRVTKLYGLITNNDQLYYEEFKVPIIKEKGV